MRTRRLVLGLGVLAALLGTWELVTRLHIVSAFYFPPFSDVMGTLVSLLIGGTLLGDASITLGRMVAGYGVAALVGIGLGLVMGSNRFVGGLLQPLVELLRPLPMPAVIPVAMLFLGIGDAMKIAMVAGSCLWPILLNTVDGVVGVDPYLVDAARSLRVDRWGLLRLVLLPAAAPRIAAGLRVSLPIALIIALVSEMVGATNGLGYFVVYAQRTFQFREMFAGIVLLGIVGYVLNRAFSAGEARLLGWHHRRTALSR